MILTLKHGSVVLFHKHLMRFFALEIGSERSENILEHTEIYWFMSTRKTAEFSVSWLLPLKFNRCRITFSPFKFLCLPFRFLLSAGLSECFYWGSNVPSLPLAGVMLPMMLLSNYSRTSHDGSACLLFLCGSVCSLWSLNLTASVGLMFRLFAEKNSFCSALLSHFIIIL